jgi:hypothetical protein
LIKLLQKLAQVEGAKPSSRVATREISLGISLLRSFSLCAFGVKEKSDQVFRTN